jgi:hypothetical protein
MINIPLRTIQSDLGITVSSLDKTYKRLLKPFARVVGKYTFAGATPEIYKGTNISRKYLSAEKLDYYDVEFTPCLMKSTRALKQRFFDFWRKDFRGKKTAIMMIDIDQENISPDIWSRAGLPVPLLSNSNPAYGTCQIVWVMSELVYEAEYYQIRDSMIRELEKFGVNADRSKVMIMRSPWYDPFFKRHGEMVKRKADCAPFVKRGVKQADYTLPTVYGWNEYDPEDLYFKESNLDDICFDAETGEIFEPIQPSLSVSDITQGPKSYRTGRNPAASTSLFDELREACYPLYSKKKIWGFELVLSLARQIGDGQSEKRITDTAKGVFEWIEREFPKSHNASQAANGKGSLWANIRWYGERAMKALLTDFAEKEGFSRQYAYKLKKEGKIYDQFGNFFYTKNKIADPVSYIEKFHRNVFSDGNNHGGSSITNKHDNQGNDEGRLPENVNLVEAEIVHKEVEIKPPTPPPRVRKKNYWPDDIEELLKIESARRGWVYE